jgi:predicted Zn-dependent peptidase
MAQIHRHDLANGLVLLGEQIPGVQSVAMSLLTPAGVVAEPAGQQGMASMLAEMICRGAGDLDAKAHSDALDDLGVHCGTSAESTHLSVGATMIGSKLAAALPLLTDMIVRPMLADDAVEPSRDLALQALDALEDEPQQKVFMALRQHHFAEPFDRSPLGQREDLERITPEQIRDYWRSAMVPDRAILGFAGNFDWQQLKDQVDQLLGDWQGVSNEHLPQASPPRQYHHEESDTVQVHIGLAYDAVPEPDANSILQRVAAAVLSGGMSGRLFTQVRERHGLCYSVFASYAAGKHLGAMLGYAGTTAPRAQQTLDILVTELHRLSQGVTADEFERTTVGMKSSLVMQGESTSARASAIVIDQYIYAQPRTLDERIDQVNAVTLEQLNQFGFDHPPGPMTIVTIGPEKLEEPGKGRSDEAT